METLRKDKACFVNECDDSADFGTIFCGKHFEQHTKEWQTKTRREKINAIMDYEHTKGLLA